MLGIVNYAKHKFGNDVEDFFILVDNFTQLRQLAHMLESQGIRFAHENESAEACYEWFKAHVSNPIGLHLSYRANHWRSFNTLSSTMHPCIHFTTLKSLTRRRQC